MKLSQIRPCDNCGGKIAPSFYLVRYSLALFRPDVPNRILGLAQYFQGSLRLAEVMSPDPEAVTVAMDESEYKELMTELFICSKCYCEPLCLARIAEKRS